MALASGSVETGLLLWQKLDAELVVLLDSFSNLLRASQLSEEDNELHAGGGGASHGPGGGGGGRERKAPGDMLEVWAERVSPYEGWRQQIPIPSPCSRQM